MAEGDEAAPAEEETKKKGGMKGMIIKIVPLLLIGLVVAKMTVLAPPPPTAAQKAAKAAVAKNTLEIKCAKANNKTPPEPLDPKAAEAEAAGRKVVVQEPKGGTTTTLALTEEPATAQGPVLTLDSVTVNLADGHFLKLGLGLQLKLGTVMETIKEENPGTPALSYVISQLRQKTTADLGPKALDPLRESLGYKVCVDEKLNFEGAISTIYFTDFVTQ